MALRISYYSTADNNLEDKKGSISDQNIGTTVVDCCYTAVLLATWIPAEKDAVSL